MRIPSLVSVIIPTYNRALLLSRAIQTVLNQSYDNWELIIIDDGSTDGTKELVKNFVRNDKRIKYFYQENKGQGAARNLGIKKSKGEFISFLDSDDQWVPDKLKKQIKLFEDFEVGLVYSLSDHSTGKCYRGNVVTELIKRNFVTTSSVIIRYSILRDSGYFNQTEIFRNIEDYDLWLRIATVSKFDFVPEILVLYQYCRTQNLESRIKNYKKILTMYRELLSNNHFAPYRAIVFLKIFEYEVKHKLLQALANCRF